MRKLVYSMGVSLDGYIAGPDGDFSWATPDEELHRFHNEQARRIGAELYGRGMYEVMRPWETAEEWASEEPLLEFARIWRDKPKVVFSTTLEEVEGSNMRLATGDAVEEIAQLKEESGEDLAVGGAGLASTCIRAGLVDEFRLFVNPVLAGGGTPFFPDLDEPLALKLVETRTFGSRVIYARYSR